MDDIIFHDNKHLVLWTILSYPLSGHLGPLEDGLDWCAVLCDPSGEYLTDTQVCGEVLSASKFLVDFNEKHFLWILVREFLDTQVSLAPTHVRMSNLWSPFRKV